MSAGTVTVEIQVNVRPAIKALNRVAIRLERTRTTPEGYATRMYVRGALDPSYADLDAAMFYAAQLVAAGESDAAAAFLRGWGDHRPAPTAGPPAAWHRLLGATAVSVGGAA